MTREDGFILKKHLSADFRIDEVGKKLYVNTQPSALQQQITELEQAKQVAETKAQVLEDRVTALENRKDLHASNLTLDTATNEVVLTVDGGSELRVGLGQFLNVVPTSQAVWDEIKALPTFKADLLAILSGEEVQDLDGDTKGFLLYAI